MLIVDDDDDHAMMLHLSLERLGFQVVSAHSCADARRILEDGALSAVVTDLRLGDGSGLEIVAFAKPRVAIVLSGSDDPDVVAESSRVGVDAYLVKPTSADRVAAVLHEKLRASGKTTRGAA